ncbi:MAG: DNA/RNA non-specific endonuclease [Opitutales bacterium]|nr:DNA/RNA non-specific endonuclease [Opitutales bacterium]
MKRKRRQKRGFPLRAKLAVFVLLLGVAVGLAGQLFPKQYDEFCNYACEKVQSIKIALVDAFGKKYAQSDGGSISQNFSEFEIANYLPKSKENVKVLKNTGYIAGFSEKFAIPMWSIYSVQRPFKYKTAERPQKFEQDRRVLNCPKHSDYSSSGYDRGHLSPNYAVGVCFGNKAQMETFLLTNIVPQKPQLNRKVWRDIEIFLAKDATYNFEKLIIVAGALLPEKPQYIRNKVAIPNACYMAILAKDKNGGYKCIGFVVPQNPENENFWTYAKSIDYIEEISKTDFFSALPDEIENKIEAVLDVDSFKN